MPEPEAEPIPQVPMLQGEMVWLRAIGRADFSAEPIGVDDAETAHFFGLKWPVGAEGSAEFAQRLLAAQGKDSYAFAICRQGSPQAIGNLNLRNLDRENGSGEVSIVITDRSLQGRGYGPDALNCLIDFAFGELRLERVYLNVFDYNLRARRSYRKAGFVTDAVLRHARFHRGAYHDVHLMSMIRPDWEALDRRRAWEPVAGG